MNRKNRIILILGIVALNIILDQVTKIIARGSIEMHEHIQVFGDWFILTHVENTGAFLSLGAKLSPVLRQIIFSWLPAIAMIVILGMLVLQDKVQKGLLWGMCFMVGGGIGNLIDRILFGSVTDFMHINLGIVRTGVFNVADVSIMIGGGLILIASLKKRPKKSEDTPENEEATASESDESGESPAPTAERPAAE